MKNRTSYRFPFSRYPAVRIALLLAGGILLQNQYSFTFSSLAIFFGLMTVLLTIFEYKTARSSSLWLSKSSVLFYLLMIGIFGALRMAVSEQSQVSPTVQLLQASAWDSLTVEGNIHSISYTSTGKERWDVNVRKTEMAGLSSTQKYRARVLLKKKSSATLGDSVAFSGMIIPISERRNPGEFDYKRYLESQDISVQISLVKLQSLAENHRKSELVWWRERALNLTDQNFNPKSTSIAKALLLGFKQDLDAESKTAFARAGLSHIMAVSGLHVGFLIAPFWVFIPFFWTKKYGRQFGLVLLILLLVCYAGITGFSASVMRASVMAAFLTYGKLFHKVSNSINLTATAAVFLLIANPAQIFEIGFQLSFSAVLIILLILPVIQNKLPYWVRIRWFGKPLMVVIVSMVVQLGLYPLQVYYFGEVSIVSPLANALFVPMLGIVVPISLLALIVSAFLPAAGFVMNYPSAYFLEWMSAFVHQAASWNWAWSQVSSPSIWFVVMWIFLIFAIAAIQAPPLRWKMAAGVLIAACFLSGQNLINQIAYKKLQVTFLDVGQGDAALLRTPYGKNVLIDAGIWSPGYNSGKSVILPHLKAAGITKLDAVILSHPHADHIGGIVDIMSEIPIGKIYDSGFSYESKLYQSYLKVAGERGIPIQEVVSGDTLGIDPAMLFLVMGPDGKRYNSDPNEHSVVVNAIYGETEVLFTGDAGESQERRIAATFGSLLDVDLLKVGHHGSRTSSGVHFLEIVTPEIAVVSLAEQNKFRHPHPEAVQRLHHTKAELFYTSREKALIFESNGSSIHRVRW